MSDPGGVLISQSVYDSVADHLDTTFFDNEERKFKNISRRIRVWSWRGAGISDQCGASPALQGREDLDRAGRG
ncbi:MAG: hypothetical protein WAL83_13820, partial [Arenicellales bacterium]